MRTLDKTTSCGIAALMYSSSKKAYEITVIATCLGLIAAVVGCTSSQTNQETTPEAPPPSETLSRLRFNQLALRVNAPLFWEADRNENGAVDPDEVRSLLFYPTSETWVTGGEFTPAFERVFAEIIDAAQAPAHESKRRQLVRQELDRAAPTLVYNDLRQLPENHRAFARHMLRVGAMIDELYARQVGMTALSDRVASDDPESQSLFRRNWGARCLGTATESEPECSAIDGAPRQPVDVYPQSIQGDDNFCEPVEARPDSSKLLTPFTVVREREGELISVPFTVEYREQMSAVAAELRAATGALSDPNEEPLRRYLTAAAQAFEDNNWQPADEAWAAMNARNSRWYVRVGPDEVYWDPCSHHAGFHLTLALINGDSLEWQDRLTPLQADMERVLADLVEAYEPREVAFHLPDFIDIVINTGDDRDPFGATIGQSLPNWGLVADEGRGRTVAMSNLYTDSDSIARGRERASSMLTAESMATYTDDPEAGLLSTILHEASHNLGPSHEFQVEGRTASEIFGGGLASMLEELKAQSGTLFLLDLLRDRQVITEQQYREALLDAIVWAFGHISRGMYTASGQRKAYSQLAAIQVGFLMDEGAIRYDESVQAANGRDMGAFIVDFERFTPAVESLMTLVMEIKATGNRERAEELAARYVDGDVVPQSLIVERSGRFPRTTFLYAVDL